jgi:hypothetical protein
LQKHNVSCHVVEQFNETYYLVFDTEHLKHVYRVETPIAAQLQVASAQARNILRELKIHGFR